MSARNFDPCSPSTSRWSKDRLNVVTERRAMSPSNSQGWLRMAPKHRVVPYHVRQLFTEIAGPPTAVVPTVRVDRLRRADCAATSSKSL